MLTARPLTSEEAALIHQELKTTPNILGYTVQELARFQDVLIADEAGSLAGVCISKDLLFGWTDIAVLYILPAHRGKGLARALYTAAWERARQRHRHIVTLSCSPEVIHMMEQFGMKIQRTMWLAPLAVHLHMNIHMMSRYRISEGFRKAKSMKRAVSLVSGTRRAELPRRRPGRET